MIAGRTYGPELAGKYLAKTQQEIELLGPPCAAVMNKHIPDGLGKYAEEIELLMLWGQIEMTKFAALRQAFDAQRQAADSAPAAGGAIRDTPVG